MHYLYRYVCILNVFLYMYKLWTIVCNKEFINSRTVCVRLIIISKVLDNQCYPYILKW